MPLESDVLGPLDKASQVALGLDGITDSVIAWSLFEERVDLLLNLFGPFFGFSCFALDYFNFTIDL